MNENICARHDLLACVFLTTIETIGTIGTIFYMREKKVAPWKGILD